MKPYVLPLPFIGLAFRFEVIWAMRRPANDPKPPSMTLESIENLRREVGNHILRDVGFDRSRAD